MVTATAPDQSAPKAVFVQTLDEKPTGTEAYTVAVKDCIDIAGTITGCGCKALSNRPEATQHARVVQTILDSKCRIVGKTNMHELAFGMTGINTFTGTPKNPLWPDRIPGGSSSGSAVAVAAGLCDFAIGTDTGGSVRQPAICCGVYGIKPTFGRIDRAGCYPAKSSLDCVGVFARTAPMLTQAMAAIDPKFEPLALEEPPRFVRLNGVADPLLDALANDLETLRDVKLSHFDAAFEAGMVVIGAETAAAFGYLLDEGAPLGEDIRARLSKARNISTDAVEKAERVRAAFTAEMDALFESADILITPALPTPPPTLKEAQDPRTVLPLTRYLRPFNLSGHPAIVLPQKATDGSEPAGVQIVGRKGSDAYLCAAAEWLAAHHPTFRNED